MAMTQTQIGPDGAVALVTGAGSGIGQAIANALLDAGARVIACDREASRLDAFAEKWPEDRVFSCPLDVSDGPTVAALPETLPQQWRKVDIVVNCAGHDIGGRRLFHEADADQYAAIIETNVIGLIRVSNAFAKGMVARKQGHIVNLGSHLGLRAVRTASAYTASKHAVHGLSETLRQDFAGTGVRITEICPGRVRTGFAAARAGSQEAADAFYDEVGECLTPQDIANAVIYAVSQPAHVVIAQLFIMPSSQIT
ncbi:MAG: 3-hydroxy acid dehydrogenase/malonic semialdehyde reductase [Gammaproteobacteria bacterium]|jgi:3-hydroxy acid dehydrogenase/malonic semialdehyde reductase